MPSAGTAICPRLSAFSCSATSAAWRSRSRPPMMPTARSRPLATPASSRPDTATMLGHLGFGNGPDFRVGLADDEVAAIALGRIEAGVGPLDQRLDGVVTAQHGHPD